MRRLARSIKAILTDPGLYLKGAKVLDFGCGTRPYESWFTAAGAEYRGADIDREEEVPVRADGSLDAGDAQFDMVVSFQVLEHVWDLETYLREVRRVLKREGRFLVSTHGSWLYHPHPGDYRRWTGEGLRREVETRGFRLITMHPLVGPLAWTTVFRALGYSHFLKKIPLVGCALSGAAAVLLGMKAWLEDRITPQAVIRDNACIYVALFRRDS
jgi:SAM-dependent methyltransferase